MIDRTHPLPITRQAEALGMARSTVYALPTPVSDRDLDLMNRIDRLHLEMPYAGSRMLRDLLNQDDIKVGRKHVATLMKRMSIEALYRKPKTTKKHPQHRVYPYLLRGLVIDRPNQVFAMDITYNPMARGFVYLVAVLDWYSRKVLSWKVSITMDVHFCLEALEEAIDVHGVPEIVNTDQGSQFTSQAFTCLLKKKGIRISMDGKGAWRDNVFIERLWRSVKYEEVYLHAYDTVSDSRAGIGKYFNLYNRRRPHSSLKRRTPDQVYYSQQPLTLAA
jgi:putative transposase